MSINAGINRRLVLTYSLGASYCTRCSNVFFKANDVMCSNVYGVAPFPFQHHAVFVIFVPTKNYFSTTTAILNQSLVDVETGRLPAASVRLNLLENDSTFL